MQRIKTILLCCFGGCLAVILAVSLFLAFAGDSFYRWALDEVIEGTIDRQITVDGTFSFELGLEPAVVVTDVWIENAAWTGKTEMARAERMELQIDLLPLLSGILRAPRVVVEGLTVELEEAPDQPANWQIAASDQKSRSAEDLGDIVYPLVDFISLSDITVLYRNRESGQEIEVLLDSLTKLERLAEDAPYEIRGEGTVNGRPFTIAGEVGTVEEAIAAAEPYPVKLTMQSPNLFTQLEGTVGNLPKGEGIDLRFLARTPSIYEVLQSLQIESQPFGPALATLQLKGDLQSLAAENIEIEVIAPSGQAFHVEGRIANVILASGLNIQFDGKLDPQALKLAGELPDGIAALLDGITNIDARGRLAGSAPRPSLEDLAIQVDHIAGAEIDLQGRATADLSGETLALADFEAQAEVFLPDEVLLASALNTFIPELREVSATADVFWEGDSVTARSVTLKGRALDEVSLEGKGRLGRFSGSDFTFDLDVEAELSGTSPSSRPLTYLVEGFSSGSGAPAEDFRYLWGDPPRPEASAETVTRIQQALAAAGLDTGGSDGKVGPKTRAAIEAYQANHDLPVNGRASERLLRHLEGEREAAGPSAPKSRKGKPPPTYELTAALPNLNAIDASLRLFFKDDTFRFEDLDMTLGKEGAERIQVSGFLGDMQQGPGGLLTGIDLAVTAEAPSLHRFSELLPGEALTFEEFEARFIARGTENVLSMHDIDATAEGPSALAVAVGGEIASITFDPELEAAQLALDVTARWPDSRSLYTYVDQEIPEADLPEMFRPELGAIEAKAQLTDPDRILALNDLTATAGPPEQPVVRLSGGIADLLALEKVDLSGEVDVAAATLLAGQSDLLDDDFGSIRGKFALSDRDGPFRLEQLSAELHESPLLSVSLNGLFDDPRPSEDLKLRTSVVIPDLASLGRKLAFNAEGIGLLTYEGTLSGSEEGFTTEGKAKLGETDLSGTLSASMNGERPAIEADIYSPLFRLADIGLTPEDATEDGIVAPAPQAPPQQDGPELLFDETPIPFEALREVDLDVDVVLDAIEGVNLDIDKAEARISLVNGEMKVDPLSFDFVGGDADITLLADARNAEPKVSLKVSAQGVDLEKLLSQTEVDVPLDGEMNVLADLAAVGGSPRALASSLDGNLDLAIEEGHLRTGLLDLATSNPARWIFSESARQGYTAMNCLILRFDIQKGLAEGKTLLLDTPNSQAIGEGKVNLRNEVLDIKVDPQPKKKRLITFSTPFKIKGQLADPEVSVSTTGASVRKGSEVLLGPVNLLGSLLPFVGGDDDEENLCLSLKTPAFPE